jgi:hypothetical protein
MAEALSSGDGMGGGKPPHLHASSLPFGRTACEEHGGKEDHQGRALHPGARPGRALHFSHGVCEISASAVCGR